VLFKIADRKKWFWILLTVPFIWMIFGIINWYIASSAQFGAFSELFTFSQMVTWFLSWIAIV
jgi:hypothetical protein